MRAHHSLALDHPAQRLRPTGPLSIHRVLDVNPLATRSTASPLRITGPSSSSQAPAPDDGGFTPVPGATSNDPLQGGSSQESACDVAKATPAYQMALRKEQELELQARAKWKCAFQLPPDPVNCASQDWEVRKAQSRADASSLQNCHAIRDTQHPTGTHRCRVQGKSCPQVSMSAPTHVEEKCSQHCVQLAVNTFDEFAIHKGHRSATVICE
jgi:hypothetical protein